MKKEWVNTSLKLAAQPADFYSGARKILRNVHFTFDGKAFLTAETSKRLMMRDCGFTKSKTSMLVRNYLNEESRTAALALWDRRLKQDKYGSVGLSTYNHYVKGDVKGSTPRGSVMGPCIQSVVLTLLNDRRIAIDVFYRTTELFKKYPADLVFLRDVLLEPFHLKNVAEVNFHFANVTCHPMYFVTLIPHLGEDFAPHLDRIKKADRHFYDWLVKWTARYVCPENMRGIQKFAQAMRVKMDADARIPPKVMKKLQRYLRDNHPGYRNDYTPPEEEEE